MIVDSEYKNMPAFEISNEYIKMYILKDFGAKIASIRMMDGDFELLAQPTKNAYEIPEVYGDFSKYDTSGADDCIPTIDACKIVGNAVELPDHGEVWARRFNYWVRGDSLYAGVELKSMPVYFQKKVTLNGHEIIIDYEVKNLSDKNIIYLYAFHGLLRYEENVSLILGDDDIINVIDGKLYDFDYKNLNEYPDGGSYKFYYKRPYSGVVGANYADSKVKCSIDYDSEILKYLGVWFTKGGFKGEYNFALEPTNGYYDSLERAEKNGTARVLEAGGEDEFSIRFSLEKY